MSEQLQQQILPLLQTEPRNSTTPLQVPEEPSDATC